MVVLYRPTREVVEVYDTHVDFSPIPGSKPRTVFLVYYNEEWHWVDADKFTPNFYEDGLGTYNEL